ncbi:hypothetical protein KUTeg_013076 [Tegillarca granosa]|uniref:inositol-1,3,4-trisphosphate 5/6-kinase n=1 Tax=Tegillarca granosa TaxID=220873 RepID=A0ABQ9EX59_TEGGR|nr:hypothetical protein KUTeg_013076 [Tegillarca granosa]
MWSLVMHQKCSVNGNYSLGIAVCKPIVAHGTNLSHEMSILFCEKNLVDVQPPCVAQTFINHNALLYKVYVIGDKQMIVERPSLKNFYAGDQETINFNSSDVSKPNCTNFLTELDSEDRGRVPIKPDVKLLEKLAQLIREECKMELFGFDVIIDCDTKKYAVIDVNAFPGYEGVDNFIELLRDHIKLKIEEKEKSKSANKDESNRNVLKHGRKFCENGDNKQRKRLKYSEKEFAAGGSYHYEKCVNAAKCNSNLRDDATTTCCQGDSSDSVISDAESQDTEDLLQWQQSVNGCGERSAK